MMESPPDRFAKGWYVVAFSGELRPGEVLPLDYFGESFALWRTDSGVPVIFDAFCPHLGAHLAHGGTVIGESLQCPFHGWRYHLDGHCIATQQTCSIPSRAVVPTRNVLERNGLIFMYFCADEGKPEYDIPAIPEYGAPRWVGWQRPQTRRLRAYPCDIVENMADITHFGHLHNMTFDQTQTEFRVEGHIVTLRTVGIVGPPMFPRLSEISSTSQYCGPGYEITSYHGYPPNFILVAHTPVDYDHVDLRFSFFCGEEAASPDYVDEIATSLEKGLMDDSRIWAHKIYRSNPALSSEDKLIRKIRLWYAQFIV